MIKVSKRQIIRASFSFQAISYFKTTIMLQVSSTEVEQDSEKIADEFLEGDVSESNVDAFLEKFLVRK